MHARMQKAFERFYDVVPASNAQVAQIIQDLNVDIAVDLSGFTKGARIGALAYRPAPLAVNMLGFPGTTGASYIDYIIADPHLISPEMQGFFTEKPVYLPDTYMPNHRERLIGTTPSRAEVGLPPQGFVFCCFNGSFKFAREVFEIWLRLLHTVPGSVLWFNFNYDRAAENLRHFAQSQGIAAERLVFSKTRLSAEDHLARLQHADVFLDTRPYNAHATAADILWAGVPVITCPGKAFAARVA